MRGGVRIIHLARLRTVHKTGRCASARLIRVAPNGYGLAERTIDVGEPPRHRDAQISNVTYKTDNFLHKNIDPQSIRDAYRN
jgi:hypothetical protein